MKKYAVLTRDGDDVVVKVDGRTMSEEEFLAIKKLIPGIEWITYRVVFENPPFEMYKSKLKINEDQI